jgi:hypothetical protein
MNDAVLSLDALPTDDEGWGITYAESKTLRQPVHPGGEAG